MTSPEKLLRDLHTSSERISLVDYAKGIGILLVVVGHTLRGLNGSILPNSAVVQAVDGWIYAFHMPLFFFLAGLFIERSVSRPSSKILLKALQGIIYPYFIWSIAQELLRSVAGIREESLVDLWHIFYDPPQQFWFLYVLLLVSLAYTFLRKLGLPIAAFLGLCALLYAAWLFSISFGPWRVLYMVRLNALYFALGAWAASQNLLQQLDRDFPIPRLLLASGVGFGLIAVASQLNLTDIASIIPLFAVVGIFASLLLARVLVHFPWFGFIKQWGLMSLQIYVAHTIFSAFIRVLLQKIGISSPSLHIMLSVAIGLYGPIALSNLCQRFNFPYLFSLRLAPAGKNSQTSSHPSPQT